MMKGTNELKNPFLPKQPLADAWGDIYNEGTGMINGGLETIQKEAGNFVKNQASGTGAKSISTPPINQQSYDKMNQKQQTTSNPNSIMQKAKNVNPLVAGGVAMGLAKLLGLGWTASAGVGAGVGAGKHLLIDKKQ